jgi:hypothetical protein
VSYALARAGLVLLALGGAWVTGLAITRPIVGVELPGPSSLVRAAANRVAGLPLDHGVVQRAVGRPAFRADRRAPAMRYDPERASKPETPAAPPVPKPTLFISGIVWGDEPAAVVEGVPGREGPVVLRPGESAAGLSVVRIQGDRVVIRGMDTTWQLTVREPWK